MRTLFVVIAILLSSTTVDAQRVTRHVPRHDITLLRGCTPLQQRSIVDRIGAAIDIGAPLFNDGDHAGCYRTYEAAAREIESTLGNGCSGPSRALRDGRATAAALGTDTERAWAMRDAFDGLLEILFSAQH